MRLLRSVRGLGLLSGLLLWGVSGMACADSRDGESPSAMSFSPVDGATGVCIDTPLSITFDRVPRVGTTGTVSVYRADGSLADCINLADPESSRRSIGGPRPDNLPNTWNYHPLIVTGKAVTISLHHALEYGRTYYVIVSPGVITDEAGTSFPGISDPNTWRFTTKSSGPPAGTTQVTVAADGTGDFCTVQGAIDFVPEDNTRRVFIRVRKGTYNEIVSVRPNKPFITVYGEDRERPVIQYANNNNLNPGTRFRMLFGVDAPDFTLAHITLHNTTPHGGSQAEAFRGNGERIVLDRVDLKSFQDTLMLAHGTAFIKDTYIEGDVDFLWGSAVAFFRDCELKAVTSNGYYTQIRNPRESHGFVFVNCRLTRADDGITGYYLSRIDPNVYPYSQVVFLDCVMGPHILPEGWLLNNAAEAPHVQFWEYRSTDPSGEPLDVSHRAPFSRQLSAEEAQRWSDPAFVLNGWVPDLESLLPPGK